MKNILLGITGGIAVYKICDLTRLLQKSGWNVKVVMTQSAKKFVTPLTFETLTGDTVYTKMFLARKKIAHIALNDWADVVLVAPATYNIIGKIASGIADDLLSTLIAATPQGTPKIIAPAMNKEMWGNFSCQENIEKLKTWSWIVVGPREGNLACGVKGIGALAKIEDILEAVNEERK